jgi:hypothetical protein
MCRPGVDRSPRGKRRPWMRWLIARPILPQHKDWSAGGALTALEAYNGLGYFKRGVPSPYLWAGTDQYKSGKYVRDGVYDPSVSDVQPGCAGMILAMMAIDPTITFTGVKITPAPKPNDRSCSPRRTKARFRLGFPPLCNHLTLHQKDKDHVRIYVLG